jgi:hypothetical protein
MGMSRRGAASLSIEIRSWRIRCVHTFGTDATCSCAHAGEERASAHCSHGRRLGCEPATAQNKMAINW